MATGPDVNGDDEPVEGSPREHVSRTEVRAGLPFTAPVFQAFVENSSDLILLINEDAVVSYVSPSVIRAFGHPPDEIIGANAFAFIHEEDAVDVLSKFLSDRSTAGINQSAQFRIRTRDDEWRWVESSATNLLDDPNVGALVIHARDVTGTRELQKQLLHSQKMDALGQLVGGIAHDFNNLLAVILNYAAFLAEDLGPSDERARDANEIEQAGHRAATLIRQLLMFARRESVEPRVIDLKSVVTNMETLLTRSVGENIELSLETAAEVPAVMADPSRMEQVLMNLVVNAKQAISSSGRISVTVAEEYVDDDEARLREVAGGRGALISVSDTGAGMDPDTQQRIFEPFFTTKSRESGTGLGLATVYGIVQQADGFITVDSRVGKGSTFRIWLPTTDANPGAADLGAAPLAFTGGGETILLVEDEQAVRTVFQKLLERHGYAVIPHGSGREAVEAAQLHHVDVALVDLVLQDLSGVHVVDALRSLSPAPAVICMTGYFDHAPPADLPLLQKPFTEQDLVGAIRTALSDRRGSGDSQ